MEIEINRESFLGALASAAAIADRKSTMPILANVLLRTDAPRLLVAASDNLQMATTAELPAIVKAGGATTVSAKDLHAFVKSLDAETVQLKLTGATVTVRGGRSKCEIPEIAAKDFPKLPNHREVKFSTVDGGVLAEMIAKVGYAVCTDLTRENLCGARFEVKDGLATMEASDGHRCAQIRRKLDCPDIASASIPKPGLVEIARLIAGAKTVLMAARDGHLFVKCDPLVLAVRRLDLQFPPFKEFIPPRKDGASFKRSTFLSALRRVGLFTDLRAKAKNDRNVNDGGGVTVEIEPGRITMATQNPDGGRADDEVPCEGGEAIKFGISGAYVAEALDVMGEERATVQIDGPIRPFVLRPVGDDGYVALLSPMKL